MKSERGRRYARCGLGAIAVLVAAAAAASGSTADGQGNWPAYLGGPLHDSFTSDAQITRAGAAHLALAWKWTPTPGTLPGQPTYGLNSSPTVVNHRIYIGANAGDFYALDEGTGKAVWKRFLGFQPALTCPGAMGFVSTATVVGATTPVVYVSAPDGYLYALDGDTGSTVWRSVVVIPSTKTNNAFNWSSPTVVGDRIYVGFSSNCDKPLIRGGLAEFNRLTGARLATFYSVPAHSVGGGVWTSAAVASTGVFIDTGSGPAHTAGDAYSVVRLNPVSLARRAGWVVPLAQQAAVPFHDADFGSSPIVFHATVRGVDRELIGVCNKNGLFYAFAGGGRLAPVWSRRVGVATSDGGSSCLAGGIWDGSRLFIAGNKTTIGGTVFEGAIRRVDPATGAPIWERGVSANILGAPSENGAGVIAAATHDSIPPGLTNQTYLLDADTGEVLSTINNNNEKEFAQPVFADQYLFLTTTGSIFAYTQVTQAIAPAATKRKTRRAQRVQLARYWGGGCVNSVRGAKRVGCANYQRRAP